MKETKRGEQSETHTDTITERERERERLNGNKLWQKRKKDRKV